MFMSAKTLGHGVSVRKHAAEMVVHLCASCAYCTSSQRLRRPLGIGWLFCHFGWGTGAGPGNPIPSRKALARGHSNSKGGRFRLRPSWGRRMSITRRRLSVWLLWRRVGLHRLGHNPQRVIICSVFPVRTSLSRKIVLVSTSWQAVRAVQPMPNFVHWCDFLSARDIARSRGKGSGIPRRCSWT